MPLSPEWIEKITSVVGNDHLITDKSLAEPYSHDECSFELIRRIPEAVVFPGSIEEVAQIVQICNELSVPLTARGGGTGLSGGCVPSANGVVVSLKRLKSIVDYDEFNHTITVEAGMTLHQLYEEVNSRGLFFPPHPGDEGACIGGAVAANAGGARAVKYGTVKRFVRGIQVVLPSGEIIALGGKFIKSSSGYNLLQLFIGSEGTLGIITQVTLTLLPPPGYTVTLVIPFSTIQNAIDAVPKILKANIIPTALEFIEHGVMRCAERKLNRSWPARTGNASLMIILDGRSEAPVLEMAEQIESILNPGNIYEILIAEDSKRQAEILEMRSVFYEALREGTIELFDVSVPLSQIAAHVYFIHSLEQKYQCTLPTYGHAADGNVHTHSLRLELEDGVFGKELPNWQNTHELVRAELYNDAIARGGVISGEHGIGIVKRDYLSKSIGEVQIDIMRKIKSVFDPKGIMNPGKVF